MTAQGQPRARFRRAIERKNLLGAETCARGMGVVSLDEALDLVCLVAEVAPARLNAYARRWLSRLADERPLTLAELDLAVTAVRALPSAHAEDALHVLSEMTLDKRAEIAPDATVTVDLEYAYCPACDYGLVLYLAASEPCPECGGAVEADIGITPEGELVEGLMLLRNPT